jgi:hypothetical protein
MSPSRGDITPEKQAKNWRISVTVAVPGLCPHPTKRHQNPPNPTKTKGAKTLEEFVFAPIFLRVVGLKIP